MDNRLGINDVFRTSRGLPENYVARDTADEAFISALAQDSHIVIYGSSKQGKTSLRKYNLSDDEYIVLTCSNNWNLVDINVAILKEAGYEVTVSESETHKGTKKINVGFNIPFLSGPSAKCDVSREKARQVNRKNLELDPSDVNDVIRALKEINFDKYIVIEDFHYLPESAQIDFSVALKAFHESSAITFIIVGVWLEEDRLTVHNGDLSGRVISISADYWDENHLNCLFQNSEALLNIRFAENFITSVKNHFNGSIFIAQQLCLKACEENNIFFTEEENLEVGRGFNVESAVKKILANHNSRYRKFITEFSAGFDQTELQLYKWIIYALLVTKVQDLEKGLTSAAAVRCIETKHPKRSSITQRKLTQSLRKMVDLQVSNSIKPIVVEFDANTSRIKVVDKGFLVWREYQELDELFDYADLTDDLSSKIIEI